MHGTVTAPTPRIRCFVTTHMVLYHDGKTCNSNAWGCDSIVHASSFKSCYQAVQASKNSIRYGPYTSAGSSTLNSTHRISRLWSVTRSIRVRLLLLAVRFYSAQHERPCHQPGCAIGAVLEKICTIQWQLQLHEFVVFAQHTWYCSMMARPVTAALGAAILECMSAATNPASKQCMQPRIRQDMDRIVLGEQ